MTTIMKPRTSEQVSEALNSALDSGQSCEILGSGSKRALGRPLDCDLMVDLSALKGIDLYEPDELVMSAAAATPLADIKAALSENRQQLAFEPAGIAPLVSGTPDDAYSAGTIGGVFACNLAGPRRIKSGAARDHLLGFEAVNGRGEVFKSGGRVVKNVTGFDLSKLLTGSFGTLAVLTRVTFRVLPAPQKTRTVLVHGAGDEAATRAMSEALGSIHDVSGAAYLPLKIAGASMVERIAAGGGSVTAIRVEGPGPSVDVRCKALRDMMAPYGEVDELHTVNSHTFWREVRDVRYFSALPSVQIWRLSVAPSEGTQIAAAILKQCAGQVFHDWGGGLVWLALEPTGDAGHEIIRRFVGDGHATLYRADAAIRRKVPVFEPLSAPLEAVSRRIKESFDPQRILNPGRMFKDV